MRPFHTPGFTLSRLWARFAADRRGTVVVLIAVALVPLIGFAGVATDTARGNMVKSRLSSALDAAALAGGRSFHLTDRDEQITMYFDANFPPGTMGATVTGPTIVVNEAAETITLTATATIETSFMKVVGHDTMTVSAQAEVTRRMAMLDVVMAIDMSGSMGSSVPDGGTRLDAARAAGLELVDVLFGVESHKELLKIGLVPWSAKTRPVLDDVPYDPALTVAEPVPAFVNPLTGAAQTEIYKANNSPVPLLFPPPSDWKGCVYNRYLHNGIDDDADVHLYDVSVGGADWMGWEPVGPEGEPVSGGTCTLSTNGSECTPCLSHGVTPMQSDRAPIEDAINLLTNATGNTNITEGLGWAWRVLMPGEPFAQAIVDPDEPRTQAIVLLTDGQNWAGNGDGYKAVFGTGTRPEMDVRLRELATNIKSAGVVIYTIQFAFENSDLQTLMKDVASGPDAPYYHYAPDGAALRTIFREVANHLSELRLSR